MERTLLVVLLLAVSVIPVTGATLTFTNTGTLGCGANPTCSVLGPNQVQFANTVPGGNPLYFLIVTYNPGGDASVAPPQVSTNFGSISLACPNCGSFLPTGQHANWDLNGATVLLTFTQTQPFAGVDTISGGFTSSGLGWAVNLISGNPVGGQTGTARALGPFGMQLTSGPETVTYRIDVAAPGLLLQLGTNTVPGLLNYFDGTVPGPPLPESLAPPIAVDAPFQVRYAANLNVVDSLINITNTGANGAMPFGPGIGPLNGNICVNVYAFSPDEQMVGCCSCHITPNGLVSLSVYNDIRAITLTGLTPNSMVIKLVATGTGGEEGLGRGSGPVYTGGASACSQSAAGIGITHPVAPAGMAAWASTGHIPGLLPVPGAPAPFDVTETPFTPATLSPAEMVSLRNRCTAILGNGSTFGTCRSCSLGGRGAAAKQ